MNSMINTVLKLKHGLKQKLAATKRLGEILFLKWFMGLRENISQGKEENEK